MEELSTKDTSYLMSDEAKDGFYNLYNYNPNDFNNAGDTAPITGPNNGRQLTDLWGADYNDAKWDTLLDQLTVSDMINLIGIGGYQSAGASSVGKTQQVDCDGPASINNNFAGEASIAFPAGVVIAATWNVELAHDFGVSIGKMASEAILGAAESGVCAFMKHFALRLTVPVCSVPGRTNRPCARSI